MGGIARRISWIRENLHSRNEYLLVEAGNTLFDSKKDFTEKNLAKAKLLMDVYQDLNYQAFAIGAYDLGPSKDFVLNKLQDSNLQTVSANLLYKNKIIFSPYRVIKYGQIKIGITSLTSKDINPELAKQDITVSNPKKCLREIIPELQKKADLIVLLSNLGQNKDMELAEKVKAIDLIIGSGIGRVYTWPYKKNNTYLLRAPSKGKAIGRVYIKFNHHKEIEELQHRFELLQENLPVDQETKEKVKHLRKIQNFINQD